MGKKSKHFGKGTKRKRDDAGSDDDEGDIEAVPQASKRNVEVRINIF